MSALEIEANRELQSPDLWNTHGFPTGLKSKDSDPIFVGDILEYYYNEYYGDVQAVVSWNPRYGAFIHEVKFASGNSSNTMNGESFRLCKRIGNVKDNPEMLRPASLLERIK
jgi:hypothetical protein